MAENFLTYNTTANTNIVGFDGKMGMADVMSVFQFAVVTHTADTCVSFDRLLSEQNAKWVISRIRFEVERFPRNGDCLTINTWPLKPGVIRFERCFELCDKDGVAVNAISDWCVIDADTSAPLRSKNIPSPFDSYLEKRVCNGKYSAFKGEVQESHFVYTKTVRLSDLDLNGHVNNISYIRMATDCFTTDEIKELDIKTFEMYYQTQCFEGDKIDIYKNENYIEARKGDEVVFKAVINM